MVIELKTYLTIFNQNFKTHYLLQDGSARKHPFPSKIQAGSVKHYKVILFVCRMFKS